MPHYCCVPGCKQRSKVLSFPKDPDLRLKWRVAIRRMDPITRHLWNPTPSSRICHQHFREEDFFIGDGLNERRRLKKAVVPSIFPHKPVPTRSEERYKRMMERNRKKNTLIIVHKKPVMPPNSRKLRKEWLPDEVDSTFSNDHFEEAEYESRRAEVLERLKLNAVPTTPSKSCKPPRKWDITYAESTDTPMKLLVLAEHSYTKSEPNDLHKMQISSSKGESNWQNIPLKDDDGSPVNKAAEIASPLHKKEGKLLKAFVGIHGVNSTSLSDDTSEDNDYAANAPKNGSLFGESEYTDQQNKKRKINNSMKVLTKAEEVDKEEIKCDFDVFAKNIATCLKKLPLKTAVLLQKKIQSLIDQEFEKKPMEKNPVPVRHNHSWHHRQPASPSFSTSSEIVTPKAICAPKLVRIGKSAPAAMNAESSLTNPAKKLDGYYQGSFYDRNKTASGEMLSRFKVTKTNQDSVDSRDSYDNGTEWQNSRTSEGDGLGNSSLVYIDVAQPCTEKQILSSDSNKVCVGYEEEKCFKDGICEEYILAEDNACIDYEERKYIKEEISEDFIKIEDWDPQELDRVKQGLHAFKDQYKSEGILCVEVKQEPDD